jgi:hypothetical protein
VKTNKKNTTIKRRKNENKNELPISYESFIYKVLNLEIPMKKNLNPVISKTVKNNKTKHKINKNKKEK